MTHTGTFKLATTDISYLFLYTHFRLSKSFNLSHFRVELGLYVFIATAHFLFERKLIYRLKSTSNSPQTSLISDTSRDTRSNFVPSWINFTTLSPACTVLITTDHSPWVVGSTATTQAKAATGSGHHAVSATGSDNTHNRQHNVQGQRRVWRRHVAAIGSILLDITNTLFKF